MPRRNAPPRRARPEDLRDAAFEAWLRGREEEEWSDLDDGGDVEAEAVEDGGIAGGDFAGGELDDGGVIPPEVYEVLQQREEEEAAAQAAALPPRTALEWPAQVVGEGYPCMICQRQIGTNGPPVACPVCHVPVCFRCVQGYLDSGRRGERDRHGDLVMPCCPHARCQVRDEDGWLRHPQNPAENLAFRDVLGEYRDLRLEVERLRAENERLQEQAQAAEALRLQNERLVAQVADLSRRLGGLVVDDDDEEQAGPPVAAEDAPVAQEVGAVEPAVEAAALAPVAVRRVDTFNDGQQPGPSGFVAAGQVAVRRGGPPVDGQQPGPSGVVARQWTAGRVAVRRGGPPVDGQQPGPSGVVARQWTAGRRRIPNEAGWIVCPCGYTTRHRGHADEHFRTHAGTDVYAAWQLEQQERRGRPRGGGGPYRRERRRHRVRGTMAFEFEEEEEIEYENFE